MLSKSSELPKAFRVTIEKLATKGQLRALNLEIKILQELQDIPTDIEPIRAADLSSFDTEEDLAPYMTRTLDNVMTQLTGMRDQKLIPLMNPTEDIRGVFTHWDNSDEARIFFGTQGEYLKDIRVAWHQAVGIHKIMTEYMLGRPLLLLDAVGVGKTLQAIGTILMRQWLLWQKKEGKPLPPMFAEHGTSTRELTATSGRGARTP